ncbi:hypothetical protein JL193_02700 [Polaribacter batillariae]|uniref:DUF4412 domain-containing protein n=1 Tax=Polaribacter batillariae TaxID=2808900 RepID=A0ABX7SZH3_9FLAO|nr:DUF6263 family protein [Polaribacter batillariae]QTD38233.1 hypothetical protein JL193_02700 [Polaribacter batillariae]
MKKLLILFVLATAFNATAQETALLRLNYAKGDTYKIDMKVTQNAGAAMSSTIKMTMKQDIASVTGDLFTSNMKIEKMSMDMMQGGQIMSYNSSTKEEDLDQMGKMLATQMKPFLKAKFTTKGNNRGEVLETTVTPNVPGAEDMLKQSGNVIYPKEAVKVGTEWSMDKNEKGMELKFNYKVVEITANNVKLEVTGTVGGMATGTISGNMNVDRKSGIPSNSKIDMKMTVQGQEILTGVESSMTKM